MKNAKICHVLKPQIGFTNISQNDIKWTEE